jgi:hypothetical protein
MGNNNFPSTLISASALFYRHAFSLIFLSVFSRFQIHQKKKWTNEKSRDKMFLEWIAFVVNCESMKIRENFPFDSRFSLVVYDVFWLEKAFLNESYISRVEEGWKSDWEVAKGKICLLRHELELNIEHGYNNNNKNFFYLLFFHENSGKFSQKKNVLMKNRKHMVYSFIFSIEEPFS